MRLRQAHTILEAATALEATGLGFELRPFDHDRDDAVHPPADDYLTGYAEFTDPDMNESGARTYHIELKPVPDEQAIEAYVVYGYGDDAPCLLYTKVTVGPATLDEPEKFRGLVGASLADRIAETVREHERPFRTAYEERARRS